MLDACFNSTGNKLATASGDGTARIYNVFTGSCTQVLHGHEGEISKICFNPQGTKVLTASSDKTCKIWSAETGEELQTLGGHEDEIFS